MPAVSSLKPSITLVIPPSPFLLDERVFVSLGILRVASILEHHGHAVHLLDLSGVSNFEAALQSYLGKTGDELFGITATTPQLPSAFKIAQLIRQTLPSARLILGGPHVTLTMAAVRLEKKLGRTAFGRASKAGQKLADMFDILVAGDGEIAIIRAVQPDSPKFLDGDDNRGEFFLTDKTYETMPAPARHLVDLRSYKYAVEGFPATSLIAQLGSKRSENFVFRAFYFAYRYIFRAATGHQISMGNFCVIPAALIQPTANISELWSHFPASLMRARIPFDRIPTTRGKRLFGTTSMHLVPLVTHAFGAFAIFADVIATRGLVLATILSLLMVGIGILIVILRLTTDLVAFGSTNILIALLSMMLIQIIGFTVLLLMVTSSMRLQPPMIPQRDYRQFVARITKLWDGVPGDPPSNP